MEQLGARITAESKAQGGATFSVYVPRGKAEAEDYKEPHLENARRIDVEATARS